MKVVCADEKAQRGHAPEREFSRAGLLPYPESPPRYEAILASLQRASWADFVEPVPQDDDVPASVHDADYVEFLRTAHSSWSAAGGQGDLVASLFSGGDGRRPADPAAATGYYGFDTTPITAGTWSATRAAAAAALTATDILLDGATAAYALCRPPGHHATARSFGGYCYLNHAALAAQRLAAHGTVAIIDIDYHHGNGTQQIFYHREDVLFVSLHADPEWEYPLFWGREDETGAGGGEGFTINLPMPAGTDDAGYLQSVATAVARVRAFAPRHLVVSAGFDTWRDDPLGSFRLTANGIGAIGAAIADLALPTVIVQEGGYDTLALGDLAVQVLEPFA
ncbi:MAG: histone deacetylase family protein [Candidatus Latescibacteria bacterium]|jgi:acetoin utilization deacetylase AcuC-like enzyme|nr:histone deacetylase family protein [Candidatus Latescibacterota bacterium]